MVEAALLVMTALKFERRNPNDAEPRFLGVNKGRPVEVIHNHPSEPKDVPVYRRGAFKFIATAVGQHSAPCIVLGGVGKTSALART